MSRIGGRRRAPRGPIRLYAAIVVTYAVLMGWWVYFFARQDSLLATRLESARAPLSEVQREALRNATRESMKMFVGEGTFLGLLMLGSVWLVVRALRHEIAVNRQQRNFLLAVTHELRSPIASARLYIQSILLGRTDEKKTGRYLLHAKDDLDRLGSMVEDILTTRRMAEGEMEIHPGVHDLRDLVELALPRLTALYGREGARLVLHAEQPVPARVDPVAVDQVLDNLVSNAVKYGGEDDRVEIDVAGDERWVVLRVRDHGQGLRGADPRRIIEPFVRGGDERMRNTRGIGLGLAIVHNLAEAHGGSFEIEDAGDGSGTVARVRFPAAAGEGVAAPAPAASAEGGA